MTPKNYRIFRRSGEIPAKTEPDRTRKICEKWLYGSHAWKHAGLLYNQLIRVRTAGTRPSDRINVLAGISPLRLKIR